jgi:hypothetical protein
MKGTHAGFAYSNLKITLPDSYAGPIRDWYQNTINVKAGGYKRSGLLEFLAPDLKTVLASVRFSNLAIIKVMKDAPQLSSQAISRTLAEMTCGSVALSFAT